MDGTKSIFKSKTMWGAFVVLLAMLGEHFGVPFTEAQQAATVDGILVMVELGGFVLMVAGRIWAKNKITIKMGNGNTAIALLPLFLLGACAGVSDKISDKSGTTLEQRCVARTTGLQAFKAQPEYSLQNAAGARLRRIAQAYQSYTTLVCPPPWGLAAPSTPAPTKPSPVLTPSPAPPAQ